MCSWFPNVQSAGMTGRAFQHTGAYDWRLPVKNYSWFKASVPQGTLNINIYIYVQLRLTHFGGSNNCCHRSSSWLLLSTKKNCCHYKASFWLTLAPKGDAHTTTARLRSKEDWRQHAEEISSRCGVQSVDKCESKSLWLQFNTDLLHWTHSQVPVWPDGRNHRSEI